MLAIGLVILLALFGAYIVVRRTAIGVDVDQGLAEAQGHVMTAVDYAVFRFRQLRPRIMRGGWIAVGLLAASFVGVLILGLVPQGPDSPFFTPSWAILPAIPVLGFACWLIVQAMRIPPNPRFIDAFVALNPQERTMWNTLHTGLTPDQNQAYLRHRQHLTTVVLLRSVLSHVQPLPPDQRQAAFLAFLDQHFEQHPPRAVERESLLALMSAVSLGLVSSGAVLAVVAAFARSTSLAMIAFMLLVGGLLITWMFARLLTMIGVLAVDLSEGIIGTLWRLSRILSLAFNRQELAALIGNGPNIADQERFLTNVDRFFRSIVSAAVAIATMNILKPHELVLLAVSLTGLVSEAVWFRLEARYVDTTDRRRRSVLLFEGLALILLALFLGKLVFLEYGNDTTSIIGRLVQAFTVHGSAIYTVVLNGLLWLILFAGALAAAWRLPEWIPAESTRFRSWSRSGSVFLAMIFLGVFVWGIVKKPITEATASTIVDGWALFTPRLEVTKTPSVNVNWTGAGPDRKTESYIVERRESTEPGFARVETLVAGTTTWEDRKVTRGKTYLYRVIIVEGSEEITSAEQRITIPEEPTAKKPEAKTKTAARSQAVPDTEPQSPAECPNGSCGQNAPLDELCRRHPAACQ